PLMKLALTPLVENSLSIAPVVTEVCAAFVIWSLRVKRCARQAAWTGSSASGDVERAIRSSRTSTTRRALMMRALAAARGERAGLARPFENGQFQGSFMGFLRQPGNHDAGLLPGFCTVSPRTV